MTRSIERRLVNGVWTTVDVDETSGGGLPSGGSTGEVLTKESNADGDVGWEAGGGSQPWTEHDLSALEADWTSDGVGTWTFVGGVISQTDATAESAIQYNHPLPSLEFVVEAEVRFPTGQDSGTTGAAVIEAGGNDAISNFATGLQVLVGEGAELIADAAGDGATYGAISFVDGSAGGSGSIPTVIAQNAWHTLRVLVSPMRQSVYLDGAYLGSSEQISGGNAWNGLSPPGSSDLPGLGAVGLADFRNIKVWTRPLPA